MAAPSHSFTKTWHKAPYAAIDPARPELSLKGKSAIVTGAGGTIGAAVTRALAKAGVSHVAILGRKVASLEKTKESLAATFPDARVIVHSADITNATHVEKTFADIRSEVGKPIDILVANAGFLSTPTTIVDADGDDWWTSFEINVKGLFISVRAFSAVAASDAVLINMSTALAHVPVMGDVPASAYAASKMAGLKLFEYFALEKTSFRVISMHPGVVLSDMSTKVGMTAVDDEDLAANFVVWLSSPEAAFLDGRMVWANWDVDELKARAKEIQDNPMLLTSGLTGWPGA